MTKDTLSLKRNRKGSATVGLHVLIWLIVFLIPYIFSARVMREGHHRDNDQKEFLYLNTDLTIIWVGLFYVNAFLLIPRLVYKRKILLYTLVLAGFFLIVVGVDKVLFWVFAIPRPFSFYHSAENNILQFVLTIVVSLAYKAISDKARTDLWIKEKQSENLKTELSFLRSQVSHHFLFNVLNNMAALARMKSDELEPTIMKLSSLMRYMLYENDDEKVLVKSEAEYLQEYIDLQKQRFGNELKLTIRFDIKEEWQSIEPMLMIPFVENAFKHGGAVIGEPTIDIVLSVDKNQLYFAVKNRYEDRETIKDKTSGIGLLNVKRRLTLLYPGKHDLTIEKKNGWYSIALHLILKK